MEDFHRTLTEIVFRAGDDLGLVLAGGYAISAHNLTSRPSQDVDFATAAAVPMPVIVDRLDDAVGMKVAALHDRATHRDFIDVHAAATRGGYPLRDLERLGRIHQPALTLADLASRLTSIELRGTRRFFDYGLNREDLAALIRWAHQWADDIESRLHEEHNPGTHNRADWDTYLDT